MKTEQEIRQMLVILRAFNRDGVHDGEITALLWALGEYPPTAPDHTEPL